MSNSHHIYDYIFQSRAVSSPAKQPGTEIGTYQIPPPPRPVLQRKPSQPETRIPKTNSDPYGTLRASRSLVKIDSGRKLETRDENCTSEDDDVFHKENHQLNVVNNVTNATNVVNVNNDRFGTLKAANRVVNRPQPSPTMVRNKKMDDYRSTTLPRSHQVNESSSVESHMTSDEVYGQTDRKTERQIDKRTERQKNRKAKRQRDRRTNRQIHRPTVNMSSSVESHLTMDEVDR